jgi:hypothetical protein
LEEKTLPRREPRQASSSNGISRARESSNSGPIAKGSVRGSSSRYFFTKTGIEIVENVLPKYKGVVVDITVEPLSEDA